MTSIDQMGAKLISELILKKEAGKEGKIKWIFHFTIENEIQTNEIY